MGKVCQYKKLGCIATITEFKFGQNKFGITIV